MAGLVFFYAGLVEKNFKEVWDDALSKYETKGGASSSISSGFKMDESSQKVYDLVKPVEVNLFDMGFVSSYEKADIEKLRKSLDR